MINLEIIERAEPSAEMLETFKQYAAVADGSQDSLLRAMLVRAILRVQEMADRSILACTLRIEEDDTYDGIRLYQSFKDIVSVKGRMGQDIPFHIDGRKVYTSQDYAEVTYTTEPSVGAIDDLMPVVYQYATALYDGQDSKALANILTQCR